MTDHSRPEAARIYRAASGPVLLVVCGLLAIFLLGDAVVRAGWGQMLLLAPWVLLGLFVAYVLSAASVIRVDSDGVVVQNMLRRTTFGWKRVRDIDMRWQIEFDLDDDTTLTCYGGPALARPRRSTQDEAGKAPAGLLALADLRERWEAAADSADRPIRRSWDRPATVALVVIVVWAVVAVLIANAG